jgi:hypothetical protein
LEITGLQVVICEEPIAVIGDSCDSRVITWPAEERIGVGCAIERHLLGSKIDLSAVVKRTGHLAFRERTGESGHGEGGEDGYDRNNNEHFD